MDGSYEVTHNGQVVGRVDVSREGLYYRILCRCKMDGNDIHRLYADGEKIGVLIPENGDLVLNTKIAVKRLKPGCAFSLDENMGMFIPICPGKPFAHLDKLRQGKLTFREGEPGLFLE